MPRKQQIFARVYKGIATASVTFHKKGTATESMRKAHPMDELFDNSGVRCDVEKTNNLDIQAAKPQHHKKAAVNPRRYERVYKRIADVNVPFYPKGHRCEKGWSAVQICDLANSAHAIAAQERERQVMCDWLAANRGAVEHLTDFCATKIGASKAYSDVEDPNSLDIQAAKPQHRRKVVATASRSECVYK